MDDFIRPKRPKLKLTEDEQPQPDVPKATPEDNADESKFVPPEEVAEKEEALPADVSPEKPTNPEGETRGKKGLFRRRINLHMPHGKKQWAIAILVILLLLGGTGSTWWFLIHNKSDRIVVLTKEEPYAAPKPKTEASKLSGMQVDPEINKRPVTAVMIENSQDARPQAGLKDASIVFEAIAEGGITRFVALFQDTQPDYIGPIRSVRPYYLDWFMPFDAAIAHVGGSPKALSDIKSLGAKDLDQFANSGSYTRVTSRFAPHNVYSSIAKLNELEASKGFGTASFTSFDRKEEKALATATAKTVDLDISSVLYNVRYDYDAISNSYSRSEGGQPHKDEKSGTQLAPKVVIAIVMQRGIDSDGQHTNYTTTGSGKVFVFQDGGLTEGTWNKTSRTAQWSFTDGSGKAIALNPGQTWISMVDTPGSVTYKP